MLNAFSSVGYPKRARVIFSRVLKGKAQPGLNVVLEQNLKFVTQPNLAVNTKQTHNGGFDT